MVDARQSSIALALKRPRSWYAGAWAVVSVASLGACGGGGGSPEPGQPLGEVVHYTLSLTGPGIRSCDVLLSTATNGDSPPTLTVSSGITHVVNPRGGRLALSFVRADGNTMTGQVASLSVTVTEEHDAGAAGVVESHCYDHRGDLSPSATLTLTLTKAESP